MWLRFRYSLRALMLGVALAAILVSLAVSIYRDSVARAPATQVTELAISPDSSLVAAVYEDGTARLWDMESGREVATVVAHAAPPVAVEFSPDGRAWATASRDGEVKVWNAPQGAQVFTFQTGGPVEAVHFAPSGDTLAVLQGTEVQLWAMNGPIRRLTTNGSYLGFSPDGGRLVVWTYHPADAPWWFTVLATQIRDRRHYITVFDATSGVRVEEGEEGCVWFSPLLPDGKSRISEGGRWSDAGVQIDNLVGDDRSLGLHQGKGEFFHFVSVAVAPTGNMLATKGVDGTIALWDPRPAALGPMKSREGDSDRPPLGILETATGKAPSMAFSSDGALLAAGGFGNVELWDTASRTIVRRLPDAPPVPWVGFGVAMGIWAAISLASWLHSRRRRATRQPVREERDVARPRRRPFRDWLLRAAAFLIAVLAIASISWFLVLDFRARRQHSAAMALAKRGATVCYDYQFGPTGFDPYLQPPDRGPLLRWLGRDFFHRVVEVRCSESPFAAFGDMTGSVEDADAAALEHLPDLQEVDLRCQPVTDAALVHLAKLHDLAGLDLSGTDITDAGLIHLKEMECLTPLKLHSTKVTGEAVERLRERLPGATISFQTVEEDTIWDHTRSSRQR